MATYYGETEQLTQRSGYTSDSGSDDNNKEYRTDSGSGDTGDTDSGSDDEEEPKLKYDRIGEDILNRIGEDLVSCMAVHSKFLAIGTHDGQVLIADHEGHLIISKEFPVHSCTVNDISIDGAGEYIASCSDDGKVVINGLYSSEHNQVVDIERPVKSVALKPDYTKSATRAFVTGNEKLMMVEKGWVRKSIQVLHEAEGTINIIRWHNQFISWANDAAVIVYDSQSKLRISRITRDKEGPRPQLSPCKIVWQGPLRFLVGWGHSVKINVVREKPNSKDMPNKFVEIVSVVELEDLVAGLAPYPQEPDQIVVLLYTTSASSQVEGAPLSPAHPAHPPHLSVLKVNGYEAADEISVDVIKVRRHQVLRCNDYRLERVPDEDRFYIVCPHDIILGKKRDVDDHVEWLLERKDYRKALEVAKRESRFLKRLKLIKIGQICINHLIQDRKFKEAAELCPELYQEDQKLWEERVYIFLEIGQLRIMAPFIPVKSPILSATIYELVLNEFLKMDCDTFHRLLKQWPSGIYKSENIISAVEEQLDRFNDTSPIRGILLSCLALLYSSQEQFDKALSIYLELKNSDVFDLIKNYNLYVSVKDKISTLLELDQDRGVGMLVEQEEKITPDSVVLQLESDDKPYFLHCYLDALFEKNPQRNTKFHQKQVYLYAEYNKDKLLNFLRRTTHNIPLPKALEICKAKDFVDVQVYLHGRMGNNKEALHLITNRLENIHKAIEFCKEADDNDLWEDLIEYSMKKPEFIKALCENIVDHVDRVALIKRIPEGTDIPGLRDALVKILQDFQLQIALNRGCKDVLTKDSNALLDRLSRLMKRGMLVRDTRTCALCNGVILGHGGMVASGVWRGLVVFNCNHVYHETCLRNNTEAGGILRCSFCNNVSATRLRPSNNLGHILT
ncbi:hypothetical protein LOD99_5156 [Oopsacas minuta]|uniref:Vacuolar protein sorting-associated protein 41 homolog n=1 Tax=Oopsacas minuta TaxID=111878 RepID=A0AAV7JS23_9METZ|nr:hypothetical protein LOD99_5156 [Oopsacas minuta]